MPPKLISPSAGASRFSFLKRWLVRYRYPVMAVLLSLALLPFFALSFYNYPFWDDFGWALMPRLSGMWGTQKEFYLTWGGRYSLALLLTAMNPLTYDWWGGFYASPLLLLGGTLLVYYAALREISNRQLARVTAGLTAALLLLVSLAWMPAIYPTFYWFATGVGYQLCIILTLLIPVAGLRALRAPSSLSRRGWYGVALFSTVVVVGLNEVAMLLLGWTLLVLLVGSWRTGRRPAILCWGGLLLCALIAGLVAVLAPGNMVRLQSSAAGSVRPALHVVSVVAHAAENFSQFISTPKTALALVLIPLLLGPLLIKLRHLRPAGFRLPLLWGVAVLLVGMALSFLFFGVLTSDSPPGRTLTLIWNWLFIGWIGVLWAAVPEQVPAAVRRAVRRVQQPATVFVFFMLLIGIERRVWVEWLRNAPIWRAQNEARFAQLRRTASAGQRTAVVAPFSGFIPRHVSIIGETINYMPTDSSERHNNYVTAQWFHLDTVRLSGPRMPGLIRDDL